MKNLKINLLLFAATCFIGANLTSCTQESSTSGNTSSNTEESKAAGQAFVNDEASQKNILQIALGSKDHTTLCAAVGAAEYENVLSNNGPLTVFAPTNAAFDALPEGTVSDLLKPENKATLVNIIMYHAAPGKYTAEKVKGVMGIGQANGQKLKIEEVDGKFTVNGANILGSVEAANGIVHVIDQVLLPPSE